MQTLNKKQLGFLGEERVVNFLVEKKYQILFRNWRTNSGEIDIIALDFSNPKGVTLVFVEVKLRKSSSFAAAHEFVDRRKQDKLRTTAAIYLSQNPTHLQPRFDVIEIYAPKGTETEDPVIRHLEDAFQ